MATGPVFFPGVGGAIMLIDALAVRTVRLEAGNGIGASTRFRLLVLPVVHILVFCYAAYGPVIDAWVQARLPVSRGSLRVVMIAGCCAAYALAAFVSLCC
ncbi:MAG TPA: hypothetical protein PKG54_03420 [Phycisphaerae bacterium]|nr:hypothetical protein [Phycisphaerae bacterium]HOB73555.1 hypothetical protein [Phycisphaerae bacterium]HOJ56023.1 hypothetical protein [Phycisphaerae bacterium]HOL25544.1 hypothetical protein [Phycisphaerae bacterium]HPP22264.1 hypothetical protein [Phycisphaerae bacterium]